MCFTKTTKKFYCNPHNLTWTRWGYPRLFYVIVFTQMFIFELLVIFNVTT